MTAGLDRACGPRGPEYAIRASPELPSPWLAPPSAPRLSGRIPGAYLYTGQLRAGRHPPVQGISSPVLRAADANIRSVFRSPPVTVRQVRHPPEAIPSGHRGAASQALSPIGGTSRQPPPAFAADVSHRSARPYKGVRLPSVGTGLRSAARPTAPPVAATPLESSETSKGLNGSTETGPAIPQFVDLAALGAAMSPNLTANREILCPSGTKRGLRRTVFGGNSCSSVGRSR